MAGCSGPRFEERATKHDKLMPEKGTNIVDETAPIGKASFDDLDFPVDEASFDDIAEDAGGMEEEALTDEVGKLDPLIAEYSNMLETAINKSTRAKKGKKKKTFVVGLIGLFLGFVLGIRYIFKHNLALTQGTLTAIGISVLVSLVFMGITYLCINSTIDKRNVKIEEDDFLLDRLKASKELHLKAIETIAATKR